MMAFYDKHRCDFGSKLVFPGKYFRDKCSPGIKKYSFPNSSGRIWFRCCTGLDQRNTDRIITGFMMYNGRAVTVYLQLHHFWYIYPVNTHPIFNP